MENRYQTSTTIDKKTGLWFKIQPFTMGEVLDALADGRIDEIKEKIIHIKFVNPDEININEGEEDWSEAKETVARLLKGGPL